MSRKAFALMLAAAPFRWADPSTSAEVLSEQEQRSAATQRVCGIRDRAIQKVHPRSRIYRLKSPLLGLPGIGTPKMRPTGGEGTDYVAYLRCRYFHGASGDS